MIRTHWLMGAVTTLAVGSMGFVAGAHRERTASSRVFELRTYTVLPGRQIGRASCRERV